MRETEFRGVPVARSEARGARRRGAILRATRPLAAAAALSLALACGGGGDGGGGGGGGSGGEGTLTLTNNTSYTFDRFNWQVAGGVCTGGEGVCYDTITAGDPDAAGLLPFAPGMTVTTPPFPYLEYNFVLEDLTTGQQISRYYMDINQPNVHVTFTNADLD